MATATATRTRSMHITDSTLRHMAANKEFVEAFSFLALLRNQPPEPGTCKPCQRNNHAASIYESLKKTIAGMADSQKILMKQMLKIDVAYVSYKTGKEVKTNQF